MASERDVIERLRVGPAVLFLGQRYLSLETGSDPLLDVFGRKYGLDAPDYDSLLDEGIGDGEAVASWLTEKSRLLPVASWLATVGEFPWSALYTSAVDWVWVRALRNEWREVQPIHDETQKPDQPRSKTELTCTLLFGSALWHDTYPYPHSSFALRRRTGVATALVRRLPEIVTPRGILVVEGYDLDDWMDPDLFFPLLEDFGTAQVHFFSASTRLKGHPDALVLQESGQIVLHDESLASVIQRGADGGRLRLGSPITGRETGHHIELEDRRLDIPLDVWRQTIRSALVLEDNVLKEPNALSASARYATFRRFLEKSEGVPDWMGFARGFAFQRDFEARLRTIVEDSLASKDIQERERPIIVHGATGSGKTMGLASLAMGIRRSRRYPVLYIQHRVRQPVLADIEQFARWAEDAGAPAVLVIWDGMGSYEDYLHMSRYLTTRGRRAIVVGSLYRTEDLADSHCVEVPRRLSAKEEARFGSFLSEVDPGLVSAGSALRSGDDFLVALYRLLPPSRLQLRAGVSREVGLAESRIAGREAERGGPGTTPQSAIQWALLDAGLLKDLPPVLAGEAVLGGEQVAAVQRLTGLVMVPGQFNLQVPLELLLRCLGHENYEDFLSLLDGTDIFEWYEDEAGNVDIGPRAALEAQIVVQSRLGGPPTEVDVVYELITNMVPEGLGISNARETEFVTRLAQALDRDEKSSKYRNYFDRVADALQFVRVSRGVDSPKLMLQEAHLRREWARTAENSHSSAEQMESLEKGREVLELALDQANDRRGYNYTRGNLLTEMASTHAMTARALANAGVDPGGALRAFENAKEAAAEARRTVPDSFYPLDVMSWATADLVRIGLLDGASKLEALAEVLTALEIADSGHQDDPTVVKLRRRQLELGEILGDADISDRAFEDLLQRGSSAGLVIRAMKLAGGPSRRDWTKDGAVKAYEYCTAYLEAIGDDPDQRLRELLLDFWWFGQNGEQQFARERVALAFTQSDWRQLHDMTQSALVTGESTRPVRLLFLQGIADFHLGRHEVALQAFRDVERETTAARTRWNVIRAYLASDPTGTPMLFNGIVAESYEGGMRGLVLVEETGQRLPFRARDFGGQPFERGSTLPRFHIAFSYQGPIADPQSAYRVARSREAQTERGGRRRA